MPTSTHRHAPLLYGAIALTTALVFFVDLMLPLGVAVWIFYLVPVALGLLQRREAVPLGVAAVATVLVAVAFVASPAGISPVIAQLNRAFGVIVLWGTAALAYVVISSRETVRRLAWVQDGRLRLAQAVMGDPDTEALAARALDAAVQYVGAQAGAFYVVEGDVLRRQAGFATATDPRSPLIIPMGTGLVGQAARENREVLLRDVPRDYARIASALGDMAPRAVIVAPLATDGAVAGVIELAFATDGVALDTSAELLRAVSSTLATALRSAEYRARLQALLEETQRQGEELEAQQEELRISNEDLEEQAAALRDSQERMEAQSRDLEQTNRDLEEQTVQLEHQRQDLLLAQETLQRNARALERANQHKTEFLANMSHELRTPLNSSLILSRLLAENRSGRLAPEEVRYAETIARANNELLALINDILDLSKVEAGRVDVELAPVSIAQITEPLRDAFAPIAAQKGIDFMIEVDPSAPPAFITDAQRTTQVLKNLLSNAVKFTEAGRVTLRVEPAPGQHIAFRVRDTGIGIPPEVQEVVFEAFRQADGSTSRRFGGTGLGLSISRQLAHALGGVITLESAVGTGSTFCLLLPLAPDHAALHARQDDPRARREEALRPPGTPMATRPTAPAPAPATMRSHRTILVIEDDAAFAQILADLAREHDFDVLTTASAEQGLALARERRPVAILLDIGLPDASGLTVLERLKRDPLTRPIPVHVLSVTDYAETALALGAVGCALKPVAREELAATLRDLEARLRAPVKTVLVAEDDAAQRESLIALLGGPDVAVETVATVREALERLAARTYDCMVLDLSLADGTGFDLLDRMAAGERYAFPPVIVYTGRTLSVDEEQHLRRYARSVVVKGARSPERLLDEATLFLHRVEADLPPEKQRMLGVARQRDAVLEGRRVLLAEDDVRNVFALSSVLEPLGVKVIIARDGREALEQLRAQPVDLVLMDIMMPEVDGLAAMRQIRADPALAHLPVIALTAKAMPEDRAECIAAGANDYMAKPVELDRLVSLLRVWMPR